jgi:hypothetical protein
MTLTIENEKKLIAKNSDFLKKLKLFWKELSLSK